MSNEVLVILKVNGKTLATRSHNIEEYNENIAWSLNLNSLMKKICSDIDEELKNKTVQEAYRSYR